MTVLEPPRAERAKTAVAGTGGRRMMLPKIGRLRIRIVVAALLMAVACSGPRRLRQGHLAYNEALRSSADSELLLNIVRLRYLDTLEFLATTSVSASTSFSVGVGGQVGTTVGSKVIVGIPQASYSSRPIFTFTPQRGAEFARKLIIPVELRAITQLVASNWDSGLLFLLLVREMNGLVNDLVRVEPEFRSTTRRMSQLQMRNDLFFGFRPVVQNLSDPIDSSRVTGSDLVEAARAGFSFRRQGEAYALTATREEPVMHLQAGSVESDGILQSLKLAPDSLPVVGLTTGQVTGPRKTAFDSLMIRTRSLLDSLAYLSLGVQIPQAHLDRGVTSKNWPLPDVDTQSIGELFTVRSAEKRPETSLAVNYRDHWFYVAEDDIASRTTFFFFAELFRLVGGEQGQAPVLTLPIGDD